MSNNRRIGGKKPQDRGRGSRTHRAQDVITEEIGYEGGVHLPTTTGPPFSSFPEGDPPPRGLLKILTLQR